MKKIGTYRITETCKNPKSPNGMMDKYFSRISGELIKHIPNNSIAINGNSVNVVFDKNKIIGKNPNKGIDR